MGMKVSGIGDMKTLLRSIAEKVSDGSRGQMKRSADKIVKEAKLNCPVDTEALMDSIRQDKVYEQRDAGGHGGRLAIGITFGQTPETERYADYVHEHYEDMEPGPATEAKRAQNPGRYIGSHFLTRAAAAEEEKLNAKMIVVVRNAEKGIVDTYIPAAKEVDAKLGGGVQAQSYKDYIASFKATKK